MNDSSFIKILSVQWRSYVEIVLELQRIIDDSGLLVFKSGKRAIGFQELCLSWKNDAAVCIRRVTDHFCPVQVELKDLRAASAAQSLTYKVCELTNYVLASKLAVRWDIIVKEYARLEARVSLGLSRDCWSWLIKAQLEEHELLVPIVTAMPVDKLVRRIRKD